MNKWVIGIEIGCAIISAGASILTARDQIKNGDRRAILTGDATGRAMVDESQKRGIALFGINVDEQGRIKV